MTKYQFSRTKIELSQHTREYKAFLNLETDEEKDAYIKKIISERCETTDDFSDDFDTIEEAKKEADSLYYTIREGFAMRYILIEYCELWQVEYDEDNEQTYTCIDILL